MPKFVDVEFRGGQFFTVRNLPGPKGEGKKGSGGEIRMNTRGIREAPNRLAVMNQAITRSLETTAGQKAQRLQSFLQGALLQEYTKSGTGRFARGIRVGVVRENRNGRTGVSLQVKAIPYRETKFLTNLGGIGYFKDFPVRPYRIFARGAQDAADSLGSLRGNILSRLLRAENGVGRLKVPRRGVFFTGGHRPGRGGGESRIVSDIFGPIPKSAGDPQGSLFFYPLWVNHPGFRRDLLSELVLKEGGTYQEEVLTAVGDAIDGAFLRGGKILKSKSLVASGNVPLNNPEVSGEADVSVPIFVLRAR